VTSTNKVAGRHLSSTDGRAVSRSLEIAKWTSSTTSTDRVQPRPSVTSLPSFLSRMRPPSKPITPSWYATRRSDMPRLDRAWSAADRPAWRHFGHLFCPLSSHRCGLRTYMRRSTTPHRYSTWYAYSIASLSLKHVIWLDVQFSENAYSWPFAIFNFFPGLIIRAPTRGGGRWEVYLTYHAPDTLIRPENTGQALYLTDIMLCCRRD